MNNTHPRAAIARKSWPALYAAIEAGDIPRVPVSLGRDSVGLPWECADLHFYAEYALDSFLHYRGAQHIEAEPEARAIFRMNAVDAAVYNVLKGEDNGV